MGRKILCTVGTSLKTNALRQGRDGSDLKALVDFIMEGKEAVASAETNSLSRILKEGDRILFLCSDTEEGHTCAQALSEYYLKRGFKAESKAIQGLAYAHEVFAMKGLRQLVDSLIDEIRIARRMGMEPVINATGGFKAEIAYATLVGLLFKVPVYYIHEIFRDIIEMPPVPVDWDYTLLVEYEEFFQWLQKEVRRTEKVRSRLFNLPPEIQLFLMDDDEGYTWLSPAGEVYYQAYRDLKTQAESVMISRQAYKFYSKLDEGQKSMFDSAIKKLLLEVVRSANSGQVHASDCMVYPRGDRPERVFYFEKEGTLHICELALHGDNYEELMRKGVKRDDYTTFERFEVVL